MSLVLRYTMKEGFKPTKKTIKSCDVGRKGMQDVMVEAAKVLNKRIVFITWLLTRFYRRKVTDEYVEYEFYLIGNDKENKNENHQA